MALALICAMILSLSACTDPDQPGTDEPDTAQPQTSVDTSGDNTGEPATGDNEAQTAEDLFKRASGLLSSFIIRGAEDVALSNIANLELGSRIEIDGRQYYETNAGSYDGIDSSLTSVFTDEFRQAVLDRYYLINDGKLYIAADEDKISSPFIITNVSVAEQGDGQYIASYDLVRNFGESLSLQSTFILGSKTMEQGTNGQVSYVDVPKISHIDFLSDAQTVASAHEASGQADAPTAEELTALFDRCSDVLWTYITIGSSDGFENDFPDLVDFNTLPQEDINGKHYYVTDLDYQTVVDKYSEIFAAEKLETFLDTFFYNAEGKLYIANIGGMSGYDSINPEFMYIGQNDGKLCYIVFFETVLANEISDGESSAEYFPSNSYFYVVLENDVLKLAENSVWSLDMFQ